MNITFVSLFSGVGGFDLGLEAAGWRCVAQVEWDKHCQAVLAHRWPNVPRWSDVSESYACRCRYVQSVAHGADLVHSNGPRGTSGCPCGGIPHAEVVAFGSPCQDLSVAGRRVGLDGKRSGLFYEATRIIREMREASGGRYPTWVVWENVAGALSSSGGRDFAAVLDELADLGAMDIAWRVLDARWFGVAQRRRRIFVVADLAGQRAGTIHTEPEGVPWHPRTGRAPEKGVAAGTGSGAASGNVTARAVHQSYEGELTLSDVSPTLIRGGSKPGSGFAAAIISSDDARIGQAQAVREGQNGEIVVTEYMRTLTTGGGKPGQGYPAVLEPSMQGVIRFRRLTPVECERLMGWPDDHTRWRADGTEVAESHRYRMCGNGVAGPVAEWVATRINAAMEPTS